MPEGKGNICVRDVLGADVVFFGVCVDMLRPAGLKYGWQACRAAKDGMFEDAGL